VDDETFNHKLHLCPTFSGECGIAFSIFQRAFSVVLSAIQETGDGHDLNETRMGLDAGGDVQIAEPARRTSARADSNSGVCKRILTNVCL